MKKLLASILIMALALSMGSMVFAYDGQVEEGDASIVYTDGDGGEIIEPPGPIDPPIDPPVDGGDWEDFGVTGLDFGTQEISSTTKTYDSLTEGAAGLEATGVLVENNSVKTDWSIYVEIGEFFFDYGETTQRETMQGYELALLGYRGPITTVGNTSAEPTMTASATLGAGDSAKMIGADVVGNGEGIGIWGCAWSGELKVLGGSVLEDEAAQAVMTWTVAYVA